MNIAYTIISIDDRRLEHKTNIREAVSLPEVTDIEFVDGRDPNLVNRIMSKFPGLDFSPYWTPHAGELGIFLSQMQVWDYLLHSDLDAIVAFEDDALVQTNFNEMFQVYYNEVNKYDPEWDFFAIRVPENQFGDYNYRVVYDKAGCPSSIIKAGQERYIYDIGAPNIAKAYQGYSGVCTLFSRRGAKKLLDLVVQNNIWTPSDCLLYQEAHKEGSNVRAYSPKPTAPMIVLVDHLVETTVHNTEIYER